MVAYEELDKDRDHFKLPDSKVHPSTSDDDEEEDDNT